MILLARHGETDDNREPIRIQGRLDTPLNDTGRAQADELGRRLAGDGIAALYSSQLARARETAEIAGRHLGLEPVVDPRLAEGDRGELEGRLWRDVAREDPELYAAWRRAGADFRFPGGESLREQQERTLAALEDVRAAGRLPALVVCHGGSIRTVLCSRDPRGLDRFHDWDVPNVVVVPA
ncbi:MAG TPA: histidine phosphatase family protein [Solirubrobacteraceae bacterium]|nr:histidine phosphatase family protein [Solirubrobacteraceae bacterium]